MDKFSKHDTSVIKGLAVMMLLCHHLGMGILPAPIDWRANSLYTIIATLCKVCVALFVLLSGYGINESHKRKADSISDMRFVKNHLIKLMKQFWFIYIIFVPMGFVFHENPIEIYGKNFMGFIYFLLDFFGLKSLFGTQTMNQTWWYMETVIVLYILFPLLKYLCKKAPVLLLAVTFVPIVIYSYFCDGSYDNCREVFWIFPFVVGILLSEHNVLGKLSAAMAVHFAPICVISVAAALIMTIVRSHFGIIADTLYAMTIIAACKATICRIKYVKGFFNSFGIHSANIFMMHSFLYCYFEPVKQIVFSVNSNIGCYLILLAECYVVSDYIEVLKKRIHQCLSKA